MIKLGVIFGGVSVEHEVSIITACQAMAYLDEEKYEVVPIYIDKSGIWYTGHILKDIQNFSDMDTLKRYTKQVILTKNKNEFVLQTKGFIKKNITEVDFILPIVHGAGVEDGTLQGYLDMIGIGYAGSNMYASVVSQDKVFMKQILEANKINIVPYTYFFDNEFNQHQEEVIKRIEKLNYPVIIKPSSLGSSIGIGFAKDQKELIDAINEAIKYDRKIVVEKAIQNLMELNCSVLGNYENTKTSAIDQVFSKSKFLTFDEKYVGNGKKMASKKSNSSKGMTNTDRILPANISQNMADEVSKMAVNTFKALNNSGVVRVDFLVDNDTNKIYVNEINTIPGSLAFYLWQVADKNYSSLLDDIITIGIKEYKQKIRKTTTFDNNILSGFKNGLKGCKGFKNKIR